jgi:type IV secretion system protein TrbC
MRHAPTASVHSHADLFRRRPAIERIVAGLTRFGILLLVLFAAMPLRAQTDPWDQAVQVLQTAFTGTIAKGLSLVSIVVGGLLFAFGEGHSKKALAGIIFGVGMAIGAVNFMSWLFP